MTKRVRRDDLREAISAHRWAARADPALDELRRLSAAADAQGAKRGTYPRGSGTYAVCDVGHYHDRGARCAQCAFDLAAVTYVRARLAADRPT